MQTDISLMIIERT